MTGTETAYGKLVSDLQNGVKINANEKIDGTLKYVKNYTGFSSTTEEQSGHYLALDFSDNWLSDNDPTSFSVELVGGTSGPKTLTDSDSFCVFRITDPKTQTVKVTSTDSTGTTTTSYILTDLVLEPEA